MSNFLNKLKEALEKEGQDPELVNGFKEQLTKAETISKDGEKLNEIKNKLDELKAKAKPLTEEEREEYRIKGEKQLAAEEDYVFKTRLSTIRVQMDAAIKKLSHKILTLSMIGLGLNTKTKSREEKEKLIENALEIIKSLERPIDNIEFHNEDDGIVNSEN